MSRIALQSSGRLRQGSIDYLKSLGYQFAPQPRDLITKCTNADLEILWVRDDDIPLYVEKNIADLGIVGQNILTEQNTESKILKQLNFCNCSLVIAVPKNSSIKTLQDLQNQRIATTYPNLLTKFLNKNRITSSIIKINGSVEITPRLNLADAICDLTQTGKTLSANNLHSIATILTSQALLISKTKKNLPSTF